MNPFDYLTSINTGKNNMMSGSENDELVEKEYPPFLVNRGLSYFQDTIMPANEMNIHSGLDKKLQYEFFLNIIRPRKRFSKWFKKEQDVDIEAVKEYYGYSNRQALSALSILSKTQVESLKQELEKGG